MDHRFRHLSDHQTVGLYLLLQALSAGKRCVRLSNTCLCEYLGVKALHDGRIYDLLGGFNPFFAKVEIHSDPGRPKSATFLPPGTNDTSTTMCVASLPEIAVMEKSLKLAIREVAIQHQRLDIVTKSTLW